MQVQPFASLVEYVGPKVPRVLINREPVGSFVRPRAGKETGRDTFWEGDADEGVRKIAEELGWGGELEGMIKEGREKLRKEWEQMDGMSPKKEAEGREGAEKTAGKVAMEVGEKVGNDMDDLQKAIERDLKLGGRDRKA